MLRKLKELGCDIDRINNRFMGDQEFYEECFRDFVESNRIEQLGELLDAGDIQEAFGLAHNLRGTLSNLELIPLVEIIIGIVEPLRRGSMEGVQEGYDKLLKEWQIFKKLSSD